MSSVVPITYIGHATLLIEMDGVKLLTDPILGRHVNQFLRRHQALPTMSVEGVDAVLISHLHFDHFDLPSLRRVGQDTLIIAPHGVATLLRRHGFRHIVEVAVGDTYTVEGVTIQATYADHGGRRPPFGPDAHCLGYLISGTQRIYFAGDTDIFPEMEALGDQLDVALLPVWGWGPTLGAGHMTPARAAEALTLLQPNLAIPIHWGTLHPWGMGWWRPRFLHTPPYLFADHARTYAPNVQIQIVEPGQSFVYHPLAMDRVEKERGS
jgi:L-ascorbate metabolism protein UlaG (beta-lactamase superfamily)